MTLAECFELLAQSPSLILFYFLAIPLTALLALVFGKGEGHLSPWKYLYATLVYLICIPGIFAVTLNIYLFLFERIKIMDADIYTQILPIFSMILTLILIRKNTAFENIPGFGKLAGLIMVISSILAIMWFLDRTHIIAITVIPFYYVLIIILVALFAIRFGAKKFMT